MNVIEEEDLDILTLDSIKESYEKYVKKQDETGYVKFDVNDDREWFSASMAGSCVKKQLYKILKTDRDEIDIKSRFNLRHGNIVHKDIQDAIKANAPKDVIIFTEYELASETLMVRGLADIVAIKENLVKISDIKTMNSFSWKRKFGRKENRDPHPSTKYELQLGTYGFIWDEIILPVKESSVVEMALIYFKKDDAMMRESVVPLRYKELAREYWEEVNEIVDEIEEPEELVPGESINVPVERWECNYCAYASKCKSPFTKKK